MKIFMLFLILLLVFVLAYCEDYKFNIYDGKHESVYNMEILKYNSFDNKWKYEPKDSQLQYNVFEDKHEYKTNNEVLKYNSFQNEWSYEDKNSQLKYNPYENKWEY